MHQTLLDKHHFKSLYTIGAVVSLTQLVVIFIYMLIVALLGPRITNAETFFHIQQAEGWVSLLRVDFLLLILVGLYLGNFPALVVSLWRTNPLMIFFAALFTLIAITLSFAGESTFALAHLAKLHAAASTALERNQFIAAGEAILANGWWISTGSYMTGILLQGAGVLISLVMLRSHNFAKITAIAGLGGNSFDLLQHLISPFAPAISEYLSFAMILYLVWYPMLARDLFRLAKLQIQEH